MTIPIPDAYLPHRIEVRPHLGDGANGALYGPWLSDRCLLDEQATLTGSNRVEDASTVYVRPGALADAVNPQAEVRVNGRPRTVITVRRRDGGGLPVPDHVEIIVR